MTRGGEWCGETAALRNKANTVTPFQKPEPRYDAERNGRLQWVEGGHGCEYASTVLSLSKQAVALALAILATACSPRAPSRERAIETYGAGRCGGTPLHWSPQGSEFYELSFNSRLEVGPHRLMWNGVATTNAALQQSLIAAHGMNLRPNVEVVFHVGTDCRLVKAIREEVAADLHCGAEQRCVEYSNVEWDKWVPPPPRS